MNPTAAVMKIHLRYKLTLLYLPWIISLSSLAINFLVAYLIQTEEGFYTGGVMTIFVFMFVSGIVIPSQTFPFSLDLSLRRKDYFKGTISIFFLTSMVTAVLLSLFSIIESRVTAGWGFNIHFFSLLDVFSQNPFWQLWIFFVLLVYNFMFGFLIAGLYQRFGKNGLYLFFSILVLLLTGLSLVFTYFQWWAPSFGYIADHPTAVSLWILLISLIFPVFAYLLLRRSSI
ncbi:hypothetical protein [Bacillus sp. SJS]|uniref:hypothetical protein n=1 Tax=Bacillus sp. SJS TaxID=1423321 RepID=UPI0004DCFF96|nr:hypothetical protein [Bacillus sp. SJS]KZZ86169.1 hypothetical protein AS29_000915 [Bacillus sp. SJS]